MSMEDVITQAFLPIQALLGTSVSGNGPTPLTIQTVSRRFIHWSKLDASLQPAIFLTQGSIKSPQQPGFPRKRTINLKLWLYVNVDTDLGPSSYANNLLDACLTAIQPTALDGSGKNRLMQIVPNQPAILLAEDFRWSGSLSTDEGLLGPQSVQVVPLEIINASL